MQTWVWYSRLPGAVLGCSTACLPAGAEAACRCGRQARRAAAACPPGRALRRARPLPYSRPRRRHGRHGRARRPSAAANEAPHLRAQSCSGRQSGSAPPPTCSSTVRQRQCNPVSKQQQRRLQVCSATPAATAAVAAWSNSKGPQLKVAGNAPLTYPCLGVLCTTGEGKQTNMSIQQRLQQWSVAAAAGGSSPAKHNLRAAPSRWARGASTAPARRRHPSARPTRLPGGAHYPASCCCTSHARASGPAPAARPSRPTRLQCRESPRGAYLRCQQLPGRLARPQALQLRRDRRPQLLAPRLAASSGSLDPCQSGRSCRHGLRSSEVTSRGTWLRCLARRALGGAAQD